MVKENRIVHGSYKSSDEAMSAIQKLRDEGYTKDQIRVYYNKDHDKTYDKTEKDADDRREGRSFDKMDPKGLDENKEGSFDTIDKNSEERSTHGSFDRVDNTRGHSDVAKSDSSEDDSLWEKIKDFFTPETYDYDKESQNPNYRMENDVLYPHRQDLTDGNRVIVLDKANENQTRINI